MKTKFSLGETVELKSCVAIVQKRRITAVDLRYEEPRYRLSPGNTWATESALKQEAT
jgi:hypothetical protein